MGEGQDGEKVKRGKDREAVLRVKTERGCSIKAKRETESVLLYVPEEE